MSTVSTKPDVSMETSALLCGIACHAGSHLAEVEKELIQLDCLLQTAINKLSTSFIALHQASAAQQSVLEQLAPEGLSHATEIRQQLDNAITGLQFQDMASQLIGSMDKRLEGIKQMLGAVAEQHCEGNSATTLASTIASQSDELARRLCHPVQQQHMECGDIELF